MSARMRIGVWSTPTGSLHLKIANCAVEVTWTPRLRRKPHPGAIAWAWNTQLCDTWFAIFCPSGI